MAVHLPESQTVSSQTVSSQREDLVLPMVVGGQHKAA